MGHIRKFFSEMLEDIFVYMINRLCIQLRLFCIAATGISLIMTFLNIIRAEYTLGFQTGIRATICIIIYLFTTKTGNYLIGSLTMVLIMLGLFTLYVVGGAVSFKS